MQIVLLTALGVGGATIIGAFVGFAFKNVPGAFSYMILSFAAGVMLAASVTGLVFPSLEYGGIFAPLVTSAGIITGAVTLNYLERLVPLIYDFSDMEGKKAEKIKKVLIFVLAIAVHNFPEGIAAGVGFGSGNTAQALSVAGGIALQNLPEGMVIITPMLTAGITPGKTLFYAALTGVIEIIGTVIGYFAVNVFENILPFALAFAGGTMLYVISEEMIPECHAESSGKVSVFALLIGFCVMIAMDFYIK